MALQAKVGNFALNTATGNQAISGVGFQPKALILFTQNRTAAGFGTARRFGLGFATSSSEHGAVAIMFNNGGLAQGCRQVDTGCLILCGASGAVDGAVDLVSFDSGGFTLNIDSTFGSPSAYIANYLALGGDDLTNAKCGTFAMATSDGSQGVTGVGFQPDCVIFLTSRMTAFPGTNVGTAIGLGFAASSSEQAATSIRDMNTNPTQSYSWQKTGVCMLQNEGGVSDFEVSLTSMDSDGFTLNHVNAPPSAWQCIYLALKGGQYGIAAETQPTSATTKATSGVGFQPVGLFLTGTNIASSTSIDATNDRFSVGVSDGTNESSSWSQSLDNVNPSDVDQILSTTKAITHGTVSTGMIAEADVQSFDSDGFTLNWTTADATAREFIYLAVGDTAVAAGEKQSFYATRSRSWR